MIGLSPGLRVAYGLPGLQVHAVTHANAGFPLSLILGSVSAIPEKGLLGMVYLEGTTGNALEAGARFAAPDGTKCRRAE